MPRSSKPLKNTQFPWAISVILDRVSAGYVVELLALNGIAVLKPNVIGWAEGREAPAHWETIVPILAAHFGMPIHSFVCKIDGKGIAIGQVSTDQSSIDQVV